MIFCKCINKKHLKCFMRCQTLMKSMTSSKAHLPSPNLPPHSELSHPTVAWTTMWYKRKFKKKKNIIQDCSNQEVPKRDFCQVIGSILQAGKFWVEFNCWLNCCSNFCFCRALHLATRFLVFSRRSLRRRSCSASGSNFSRSFRRYRIFLCCSAWAFL